MEVKPIFDDIAIAVLIGYPVKTTAVANGFSVGQVKTILNNYCRRANPAAVRAIQPGRYLLDFSVSMLRKHRDRFLPSRPASARLAETSSIWCLPGVPAITLIGMYDGGINTIGDLMKTPIQVLSRLPKVGPEGLRKTVAALRSNGFAEPWAPPDCNNLRVPQTLKPTISVLETPVD